MPKDIADRDVIVVDPMLATGGSGIDAVSQIKLRHPKSIKFDKVASECAMYDYWRFYAYQYARKTGKPITYLTLAALHHKGPSGCYKIKDTIYYKKIFKELQKQGVESWEGVKVGVIPVRSTRMRKGNE